MLNTGIINLESETALWIMHQKEPVSVQAFYYYLNTLQIGKLAAIKMLAAILDTLVTL